MLCAFFVALDPVEQGLCGEGIFGPLDPTQDGLPVWL